MAAGLLSGDRVWAQGQAPSAGTKSGTPDRSREALATRNDTAARLTTAVKINGVGPFQFLVDTGANRSGISLELATALKLPPGRPVRVHGIAAAYMADTVDVADFRVGSLRTRMHDAPVFARADLGADGLIGIDVLKDHELVLDFEHQRIEISRNTETRMRFEVAGPAASGTLVEARQKFGQLTIVDAEAGRARMTCFLDTGASQSVGNNALRAAVQARQRPEEVVNYDVVIHGATGQTMPAKVALVPRMRIGGLGFTQFGLAFADLHTFDLWGLADRPALLIGVDLLHLFDLVSIDFSASQVLFVGGGRRHR